MHAGGQRDAVLFRDLVESKQRRVLLLYALLVAGYPSLLPATAGVDSTLFSKTSGLRKGPGT